MRRASFRASISSAIAALATLTMSIPLPAQDEPVIRRLPQGGNGFLFTAPRVSLGLRGGFDLRTANGQIFDFFTDTLTLDRSDFNAPSLSGELAIRVADPMDLVLSAGHARRSVASEFRNYVDQDDLPITQSTMLATTPLVAGVRWYLAPRGRQIGRFVWIPQRFRPYVGLGLGAVRYELEQAGSFVDYADLSIFTDNFQSDGWATLGLVMTGVEYSVGTRVFLSGEARYLRANGDLRRDFVGYDDGIDLSGLEFSAGLHFRL
jgi:hypothetical protein